MTSSLLSLNLGVINFIAFKQKLMESLKKVMKMTGKSFKKRRGKNNKNVKIVQKKSDREKKNWEKVTMMKKVTKTLGKKPQQKLYRGREDNTRVVLGQI